MVTGLSSSILLRKTGSCKEVRIAKFWEAYFSVTENIHEQVHELTVVAIKLAQKILDLVNVLVSGDTFFSHLIEIVQNLEQVLNLDLEKLTVSSIHHFPVQVDV